MEHKKKNKADNNKIETESQCKFIEILNLKQFWLCYCKRKAIVRMAIKIFVIKKTTQKHQELGMKCIHSLLMKLLSSVKHVPFIVKQIFHSPDYVNINGEDLTK